MDKGTYFCYNYSHINGQVKQKALDLKLNRNRCNFKK